MKDFNRIFMAAKNAAAGQNDMLQFNCYPAIEALNIDGGKLGLYMSLLQDLGIFTGSLESKTLMLTPFGLQQDRVNSFDGE